MLIKPKITHQLLVTENYIMIIENNVLFITDLKIFHTDTELIISYVDNIVSLIKEYKIKYLVFDDRMYDKLAIKSQIINFQGLDYFFDAVKGNCDSLKLIIHITNKSTEKKEGVQQFYDRLFNKKVVMMVAPDMVSAITTLGTLNFNLLDKFLHLINHPIIRTITSYLLIGAFLFNLLYSSFEQREIIIIMRDVKELTTKLKQYEFLQSK